MIEIHQNLMNWSLKNTLISLIHMYFDGITITDPILKGCQLCLMCFPLILLAAGAREASQD